MLLIRALRVRLGRRSDEGGALVAVVGLAAILMAFILLSSSMVVTSFRYSDTTRAGVQAQAAAQAGVAVVAAQLTQGTCALPYTSSTTPKYSVTLSYQRTVSGTTWLTGCPSTSPDVTKVKLVSVGTANAYTAVQRTVEAIYNYIPMSPGQSIVGSGAAVYGYNVTDATLTNLTINQSGGTGSAPGIEFKSGNVSCQTGGSIQGDVILGSGIYRSPSGCTINGDLWASNTVQIGNNSLITGNVHATGTTSPVVQVAGGASVNGNVTSSGPVNISGTVGGSVIAGPTGGQSTVSGTVTGSFTTAGTVSVTGHVGSVVTNSSIVTPTPPTVPPWVDFTYNRADWIIPGTTTMFDEVTPSSCAGATVAGLINAATVQRIVRANAACPGAQVGFQGNDLTLKTDVVLVADSFDLKSMTITSAAGTGTHRLWIISPDTVANQSPDCASGTPTKIENQVVTDPSVDVFIYTPCGLTNSGSTWWGQIYAASIAFNNNFTLNFVSMGLPGVNFGTGQYTSPTPPTPGHLDTVFSVRNISG